MNLSARLSALLTSLLSSACCVSHGVTDVFVRPVAQAIQPQAVFRIQGLQPDQKVVALTIDDAPSKRTGEILDMLRAYQATATFFVHGDRIETAADAAIIRRMLREGHEIAHHMPESVPSYSLPPSVFRRQFLRNDRILRKCGASPRRFRPSHGASKPFMRDFMNTEGAALGYLPKFYLASLYTWDIHIAAPDWYAHDASACAKPGRITVFHDNQDVPDRKTGEPIDQTARTLKALPTYFEALLAQGFTAKSLAEVEALAASP